jgi:outer membrane usher protein FimD/PapC
MGGILIIDSRRSNNDRVMRHDTTAAVINGSKQQCKDASNVAAAGSLAALVAALGLSACSVTPPSEVEMVEVDAKKISLKHSSFSAHVANDAGSVNQTFAASLDPKLNTLTRLESSFTQHLGDDEKLRVGDTVSSVGMWGSSVRFGGMQLGTRSTARADVVDSELATSGVAVLPTVADALFASLDSNQAPLAAHNVAIKRSTKAFGGNGLGLTAQDALGRTQAIDAPMISSVRLVEEGCDDFSVGLGKVRREYAIESNDYGPVFANTTVSCGTPLGFTLEGHGEYLADEVTALGVGVARKVGVLGTASLAIASSYADVGSGWLARVGFEHRNPWFNLALGSRVQSREFREINTIALTDPVVQRDLASIGIKVAEGANLSLAYATQMTFMRERANLLAVRQSMNVGIGSLSVSAGHSLAESVGSSVFVSYQRPFGTLRRERSPVQEFDLDLLTRGLSQ